jgi:hypothetical protein
MLDGENLPTTKTDILLMRTRTSPTPARLHNFHNRVIQR